MNTTNYSVLTVYVQLIIRKHNGMSQSKIVTVNTQGIHKRMVRYQKLTRNLFLTLYGHNIHRQQRQLSKFLMS